MENVLLSEIQTELRRCAAKAPALKARARVDKIYEVYVLSLVMQAVSSLGAQCEVRDHRDNRTSVLSVRLAPGLIYSPTTSPGYVWVSYNGNEYELHNGIRVLGMSRVLHELDVSVVKRDEATKCRANRVDPLHSRFLFLAECKFYGSRLPLHLGREYLGLIKDFRVNIRTLISNSESDDMHTLITKHRGKENFDVSPHYQANAHRFVQWLANELRQILA